MANVRIAGEGCLKYPNALKLSLLMEQTCKASLNEKRLSRKSLRLRRKNSKEKRTHWADVMRRQEMKNREKVHTHKRCKKRPQMGACSRKKIAFVEYEPEVITIKEMKKPRNTWKVHFSVFILFRIRTKEDTYSSSQWVYRFLMSSQPYLKFIILFYAFRQTKTRRQMKKSMKWNIIGILTLIVGLSLGMTSLYESAVLRIGEFTIYLENSFMIIFSITSGLMCFTFGLFYGLSQLFSWFQSRRLRAPVANCQRSFKKLEVFINHVCGLCGATGRIWISFWLNGSITI